MKRTILAVSATGPLRLHDGPELSSVRRSRCPADSAARPAGAGTAASIADTKWQDLFPDQTLNQMVAAALANNFDLRIAAERVEEARAQLGITRANQYPFVDAQAGFTGARSSSLAGLPRTGRHEPERFLHFAGRGAFVGAGYLGPPAPPDRSRARQLSGQRRRPPRGGRVAGLRRDGKLLPAAGAGPRTGDQPQDPGTRQGQPESGRIAPPARRRYRPRCQPGGAVALYGERADRGRGTRPSRKARTC